MGLLGSVRSAFMSKLSLRDFVLKQQLEKLSLEFLFILRAPTSSLLVPFHNSCKHSVNDFIL